MSRESVSVHVELVSTFFGNRARARAAIFNDVRLADGIAHVNWLYVSVAGVWWLATSCAVVSSSRIRVSCDRFVIFIQLIMFWWIFDYLELDNTISPDFFVGGIWTERNNCCFRSIAFRTVVKASYDMTIYMLSC
jgi:hypothetical protein